MRFNRKLISYFLYAIPLAIVSCFVYILLCDTTGAGGKSPYNELFFGYEEEGFVYYPIAHRNYFFIVITVVLLMSLLLIVIYNLSKRKSKLISKINNELTDKNKTILDSINYGLMIQKKIIPSKLSVSQVFENNFVIFYPKDIVSGDIYQFFKIKNTSYVVCIDCTGHGVPGAFLTIIATNALAKVIDYAQINSPKDLLTKMCLEFNKSVAISGAKNYNDSMTVSICSYCNDTNHMQFAGVNSKVLVLQNNIPILLNGTKQDICELNETNSDSFFKGETYTLTKNDSFYLFSDGFQDQFGGIKNKKIGIKNFKSLLETNSKLSVLEQEVKIAQEFINWKGKNEQTDDILLIGVKI